MKTISFLIALSLSLLLAGCHLNGTEGGNPQYWAGEGATFRSELLAFEICKVRNSCATEDPLCQAKLLENVEMTNELRMNPPYRTLIELSEGERLEKVVTDVDKFPQCLTAVKALACSNFTDYSTIHLVLRADTSCTEAFIEKQ